MRLLLFLVVAVGAQEHPMPVLPERYEVVTEANIVNGNRTIYQREIYDGVNARVATITWDETSLVTHQIELEDVDVQVTWTSDGYCVAIPRTSVTATGFLFGSRSANGFLGGLLTDTYAGSTVTRGIQTDIWTRNVTGQGFPGFPGANISFDYNLAFEFSRDWTLRNQPAPIRATLQGRNNFPTEHSFYHIYDFFDYMEPDNVDRAFRLPYPVTFNGDLFRKCNATALTDLDQRAAVLALSVQGAEGQLCDPFVDDKPHPMPILPDQYEVLVEANIVEKNYTSYQREIWDGIKKRVATVTWGSHLLPYEYEHRIELADAGVSVFWTRDLTTCMAVPLSDLRIFSFGGAMRTANTFLGARPEDKYCGARTTRGIATDVWSRNVTSTRIPGQGPPPPPGIPAPTEPVTTGYSLAFEFSQGWDVLEGPSAPVRATLDGFTTAQDGGHTFTHVYDFFGYQIPQNIERDFTLPMPVSFDARVLKGRCNASSLTTDFQRQAVLALPTVDRLACTATESKPLPVLPDRYQVRLELNVVEDIENEFTMLQDDFYDGPSNRVASTVWNGDNFEHHIELGDADVYVNYDRQGKCILTPRQREAFTDIRKRQPHILNRQGRPQSSNEYLGGRPEDKYCGPSEARGIKTDAFVRNASVSLPDGDIWYRAQYEYSQPTWDIREVPSPVRAYFDGYNSNNGQPYNFRHVVDYVDFRQPNDFASTRAFQIPFPVSFDPTDLEGYCNATALTTPAQKAAAQAFNVQGRVACGNGVEAAPHPMPTLPDQYSVKIEFNVIDDDIDEQFSTTQQDWYDGPNARVASTVWTKDGGFEHHIELGDANVRIKYNRQGMCTAEPRDDAGIGNVRNREPHVIDRVTGQLASSNSFLGARETDKYCGPSTSRGIPTDAYVRNNTVTLDDGNTIQFNAQYEFSQSLWDTRTGLQVPVRAYFNGYDSINGRGYNFQHQADFFDFTTTPPDLDRAFTLPVPISFDARVLEGHCNASSLTTPTQRAAVLALAVRNRIRCEDASNPNQVSKPHPIPELPNQYELHMEGTLTSLNTTFSAREYYDGLNNRLAQATLSPIIEYRIDLVEEGILIIWNPRDPTNCRALPRVDVFAVDESGQMRSSNYFLGAMPDDKYCGTTTTRGIPTDVWKRNGTMEGPLGEGMIRYDYTFEVARPGWQMREDRSPIRATFEGYTDLDLISGELGTNPTNFYQIYDFYDYNQPNDTNWDRHFDIPLPMSFDEDNLDGYCNASALVDPIHQEIVRNLRIRASPFTTGFGTNIPSRGCSNNKSKTTDVTLTIIVGAAALVVGMLVGPLCYIGLRRFFVDDDGAADAAFAATREIGMTKANGASMA